MAKLLMTDDALGSPDHLNTHEYKKGETYTVGDPLMPAFLAESFVDQGVAKETSASDVAKAHSEQAHDDKGRPPGPTEKK